MNSRLFFAICCFVFLTINGALAIDGLPELNPEKYELANGLDVILLEDHTTPLVACNIWYHVGSKNEVLGRTGFAHLFEHMMFQGSENHDTDFFMPLEKIGAFVNGSTTEDRTNYINDVQSNYLELALWLEADRMGFLVPAMTEEKLNNQRDVVMNERRQRVDNQPYGIDDELLREMMYDPGHPYYHSVIGRMDDLSVATLEDVSGFFNDFYNPNNASLCVVGDFNTADLKQMIDKYFGSIPAGPPVDRQLSWEPSLASVRRAVAQDDVPLPKLYMRWHSPKLFSEGDAAFDLISSVLGDGKNSRMFKELVYDRQIAQNVAVFQSSREITSQFCIEVTAKPGHTLAELEIVVDEILSDLLKKGISKSELRRAQTSIEVGAFRQMETVGGFGGLANMFNRYNTHLGDPNMLSFDMSRYMDATVTSVMDYARQYINLDRRVILHIEPYGQPTANEAIVDRSVAPGPAAEPTFTPPAIQRSSLENGLEILLVEDHDLPLIQANLIIKSGWSADPANRPGAAALTGALLDEGTRSKSALEISEVADNLGAGFGTFARFDNSQINLSVLSKHIDKGLNLMADVLLNPTFPEAELERLRINYTGRIQQENSQPIPPAIKTFQRLLFGKDHPYGQPYTGTGTEASISAITRDDLVRFHEKNYLPNNATMVVSGDISMDEVKKKLSRVFKKWESGDVASHRIPPANPIDQTRIYVVDSPGAAQSVLMMGHEAPTRKESDYLATDVMNTALGGTFISRVNMNLREDKGYTYGANTRCVALKDAGFFFGLSEVQTEVTKDAVFQMVKEISEIRDVRPLSDEEVFDSKASLIKGFPQGFQRVGAVAGQLGTIVNYNLPLNYWETYMGRVEAITGAAATDAARNRLHPDNLLIVITGDAEIITPGLEELGYGEVQVLTESML